MALRSAHGRAKELGSLVVVETLPADELPAGVPGPARPEAVRDDAGRFVPGAGTAELARTGARAAHESRQLAALLGFFEPDEGHKFAPYARLAREHREAHGAALASSVGGGALSPGVSSIVATAAMTLAASRYIYDQGARAGDAALLVQAARLAAESRSALLTAHELAAREAVARGVAGRQSGSNALIDTIRSVALAAHGNREEERKNGNH